MIGTKALPEEIQVDFLDYLEWLMKDDFAQLKARLKDGLGIKHFPERSDEQLVEGVIVCTDKDFKKKSKNQNFYICHALCILKVVEHIFTDSFFQTLKTVSSDEHTKFLVKQYEDILLWILRDVEDLCSLYYSNFSNDKNKKYRSYIRNRSIHTASVHQVLRQGLYGTVSFHSFADKEISASIGTIRLLIELRMRRSFGAMGYFDRNGAIYPLDMSILFDVLKKYRRDIHFPIKLENIIRIYKWANTFIHSGKCDYSWLPYFIELLLREFSFGKEKGRSWSISNGISTSQETIDAIHTDLELRRNQASRNALCSFLHRYYMAVCKLLLGSRFSVLDGIEIKYHLLSCPPECEIQPSDKQ